MPLIFVTGVAGSGKSAVARELRARGFRAYDVDSDNLAAWYRSGTTDLAAPPTKFQASRPGWLRTHEWRISLERVTELERSAGSELLFICGTGANRLEVMRLCSRTICLTADEATLRRRLTSRRTGFGRTSAELARIFRWRRVGPASASAAGAILLDATGPLDQVVEAVLERAAQ